MTEIIRTKSGRKRALRFTSHALMNLKSRGITKADVVEALEKPSANTIDPKTGHIVSRLGDARIVSKKDGACITVITVMRADEFALKAG